MAGPSTLLRHLSLRAINLNKVGELAELHRTQSQKTGLHQQAQEACFIIIKSGLLRFARKC